MPDQPQASVPTPAQIQDSLHQLSQVLRQVQHLEPEAKQALADLVDELGKTVDPKCGPPGELAQLVASAATLGQALRAESNSSLLAAATRRLEEAAFRAEARAPAATAFALRLLDVLADLGI